MGSNWSNIISDGTTNNPDFDYDSVKAAFKTAQAIRGGVGEILDINPDKFMFKKASTAHFRAQEVLESIKKGERPGTANRDGAAGVAYDIIANPYLTSETAWIAFDSSKKSSKFGIQLKQGASLQLDPQNIDYDTKEMKYSATEDFTYGFNDARNMLFSSGLNV